MYGGVDSHGDKRTQLNSAPGSQDLSQRTLPPPTPALNAEATQIPQCLQGPQAAGLSCFFTPQASGTLRAPESNMAPAAASHKDWSDSPPHRGRASSVPSRSPEVRADSQMVTPRLSALATPARSEDSGPVQSETGQLEAVKHSA